MAGLAGRVRRLEPKIAADLARCQRDVQGALLATMTPEHVEVLRTWYATARAAWEASPREMLWRKLLRLEVPALPRAMCILIACHFETGGPLDLRPEVAEVYLADPDAWPLDRCADCGYLWPVQCEPLGRWGLEVVGRYTRRCFLCDGSTGEYDDRRRYRFPG